LWVKSLSLQIIASTTKDIRTCTNTILKEIPYEIELILKENNPGLIKIHQFMEMKGLGKSKIYQRFDDVYVPPIEYDDIEKTLKEQRCVFIIGTAEYGKTFTAIKLMWDFHKKHPANYLAHQFILPVSTNVSFF